MNSIKLSPHAESFLHLLNARQIKYLIVGGFAVRYYGYRRSTVDLDCWISTDLENAQKLTELLRSFSGAGLAISPDLFQHPNRIIRVTFPPASIEILNPIIGSKAEVLSRLQGKVSDQIELLTIQSGVQFEACYQRRVVETMGGIPINIIGLEDLKAIKKVGNRPKDIVDLNRLG